MDWNGTKPDIVNFIWKTVFTLLRPSKCTQIEADYTYEKRYIGD